ncbi:hypothetical protein [Bradyrhizobium sp. UFLA05-112]
MSIVWTIIVGCLAGVVAKIIMPASTEPVVGAVILLVICGFFAGKRRAGCLI